MGGDGKGMAGRHGILLTAMVQGFHHDAARLLGAVVMVLKLTRQGALMSKSSNLPARERGCVAAANLKEPEHGSKVSTQRSPYIQVVLFIMRSEVRSSFFTTTVRDESQVPPQGRHR